MGIERRQNERLPLNAEVLMVVLVPDETFSPNYVRGIATDVSVSGVRVKSYQMTREDYHRIIRGVNFAKLELSLPYLEAPLPLRARIVWIEFHDRRASEPPHCILGMKFDRVPRDVEERLNYVMARIGADSLDAVPKLDAT